MVNSGCTGRAEGRRPGGWAVGVGGSARLPSSAAGMRSVSSTRLRCARTLWAVSGNPSGIPGNTMEGEGQWFCASRGDARGGVGGPPAAARRRPAAVFVRGATAAKSHETAPHGFGIPGNTMGLATGTSAGLRAGHDVCRAPGSAARWGRAGRKLADARGRCALLRGRDHSRTRLHQGHSTYPPSANGSVDRSAASSQRRVRQQNRLQSIPARPRMRWGCTTRDCEGAHRECCVCMWSSIHRPRGHDWVCV